MDYIGRYKIECELGRGAMGVALRAIDSAICRTVVIKTIRLTELADPAERQRLRDRLFHEARSAGILSHPGIVTIYDVAEEDELAYIAMEFVNGPTLDQLMSREQPLEPATLFRILRETAAALDFAHKKGIVHRDIKPANIMIHEDGTVKITDFGVAKMAASQLTAQAGVVLGAPSYISPEQALGKPVDGRSDQFSLAVIAYEMLAGEKPFVAEEVASLVYKIAHQEPAPLHTLNPKLGWPVEVVLRRTLEKGPAARYASCTEFVSAFEAACQSCTGWAPIPRGRGQNLPTPPVQVAVESSSAPATLVRSGRLAGGARRKIVVVVVLSAMATVVAISIALMWNAGRPQRDSPPPQGGGQPADASSPGRPSPAGPAFGKPEPQTPVATPAAETAAPATQPEPAPPQTQPSSRPPSSPAATVMLRTSPPGASVILDDSQQLACTSPCSLSVPPGRHTASASMAGYRPGLRIFRVPEEPDLFIYLARMTGQVQVLSDPPGAAILVDERRQTETTPATLELPAGKHVIAVVKEGYPRNEQELEVKDSAFVRMNFTLGK
jgi:serine/threonine-protein kinase